MIASPLSSIRPEQELARLTLESENVKEKIRRRSTIQTDRPSLGQTDGLPFFGPLTQPSPRNDETNTAILQSPVDESVTNPFMDVETSGQELNQQAGEDGTQNGTDTIMNDNSSEVTLVSKSNSEEDPENTTKDEQQSILDNKENLSPINSAPPPDHMSMQTKSEPLAPASPSRLNAQAGGPPLTTSTEEHSVQQEQITYLPPPGKPPPVPPRNPLENTTTKLEEYAKQQDVTEVIEHVLNQLSSAIRPTGIDNSGEQQDEVHDLFYGQLNVHYLQEKETVKTEQFRNIITRIYNKPSDVYAAIDNAYDLQRGGNEINEFTSITRLPPVLSISFDRVVWNNVSKRSEKSNHHVQTPETIYMDRYLESPTDSDLMQRRRQTWDNKQELSALSARRAVLEQQHGQSKDMPTLLEDAKLVLERLAEIPADSLGGGLDIDPKTISNLGTLADNARAELEGI
jgi:ubiquitin carboxyl-terminal hydrolase 25/28